MMRMEKAVCEVGRLPSVYTPHVFNPDLRFASAVDEGADRVVSSGAADVQLGPVPRLDQTDEVRTLLLHKDTKHQSQLNRI